MSPIDFEQMPLKNPYIKQWEMLKTIARHEGKAKSLFGIEWLFNLLVCAGLMLMPAMLVRWIAGKRGFFARKLAVDRYAVAKPLFLAVILFSPIATCTLGVITASIFFADLYLYLLGLVFLRRFYWTPVSHGRSLLLLGINFCEALLAFAVFYRFSQSIALDHVTATAPIDLLYFSCVTAATVGYGDFAPNSPTGKALIVLQILSSLGFISVFVASFVTNFNNHETK